MSSRSSRSSGARAHSSGTLTPYHLVGRFIETCNCAVICPCWVSDEPDEEFCAGLFVWTFDAGSTIAGQDVAGSSLVSATIHGGARRSGSSQTVIFVDQRLDVATAGLLADAFAGRLGGDLTSLAGVNGVVLGWDRATISCVRTSGVPDPVPMSGSPEDTGPWSVTVISNGARLIQADGKPLFFDGTGGEPLTVANTALTEELGEDAPVIAQRSEHLRVDVAALPGAPVDVTQRSGMTGRFRYASGARV